MIVIGVLALQGSIEEHVQLLETCKGVRVTLVKKPADITSIDGIILPGGESTTLAKLLTTFQMMAPLKQRIQAGMPVYGTCAGMILLANKIIGEEPHLGLMDIEVRRNAFGRQLNSFQITKLVPAFGSKQVKMVFIRAPWIEHVGPGVNVLYAHNGHVVAAQEKHMLVTSFHPELTNQNNVHRYFVDMVKQYKNEA